MANMELTNGTIVRLMQGEPVESPIVQIVGIRNIKLENGPDVFRLCFSDGLKYASHFMTGPLLSPRFSSGEVTNLSVVQLDRVSSTTVAGKVVKIIQELTILMKGSEVQKKIGNPDLYSDPTPAPTLLPSSTEGQQAVVEPCAGASSKAIVTTAGFEGVPVLDVNPFVHKSVPLRARIVQKTEVRTWANTKGTGKVFNMELLDDTGAIRIGFFNDEVDKFYSSMKIGQVVVLKSFGVKPRNVVYNSGKHGYELVATKDTSIEEYTAGDCDIPMHNDISYKFVKIGHIPKVKPKCCIDVIGVCHKRGELQRIPSRTNPGDFMMKRDLWLVDSSLREVILSIWGKSAEDFTDDSNSVIAVKSAQVSAFGGRSLTCSFMSTFTMNPPLPEAASLRQWFDECGKLADFIRLSVNNGGQVWKTLGDVMNHGSHESYFTSKVTVLNIRKKSTVYKACVEHSCNKKLMKDPITELWLCQKCNKEGEEFKWRIRINVNLSDETGSIWATCFNDAAELILGHSAQDLGPICENGERFDDIIAEALLKSYIVKCRSRNQEFSGLAQISHDVLEILPINNRDNARKLVQELKEAND